MHRAALQATPQALSARSLPRRSLNPSALAPRQRLNQSRTCRRSSEKPELLEKPVDSKPVDSKRREQPDASTSQAPEAGGPGGPEDDKPIIVKFFISALARVWAVVSAVMSPMARFFRMRVEVLLFFMGLFFFCWVTHPPSQMTRPAPVELVYSQFVDLSKRGMVNSALVDESSSTLHFTVDQEKMKQARMPQRWYQRLRSNATPEGGKLPLRQCSTRVVDKDTSFVQVMLDNKITFGVKRQTLEGSITKALSGMLFFWLPILPFVFIMKRLLDAQSGKSKKPMQNMGPPDTTFKDVAGVDVVKAELQEAVACLRDPAKFEKLNAQMPSGILLSGPPGTGKTLLARAVAGEAGVPFFAVSASEFVEMFVGRGAARIRELFQQARKVAPAVIFIDELDAVGSKRGLGVNDERDQTLNQLLTELDGFERRPSVLLLAATNRPEVLDKALLRPGRISRRVIVPLPDAVGRRAILGVHMANVPMESDEYKAQCADRLADITPGFSGAELFNVVNEGALLAARRDGELVTLTDYVSGVQRTRDGVNARPSGLSDVSKAIGKLFSPDQSKPARASPLF